MRDVNAADVQIVPIADEHIESYHACLDAVARERLHLAFLQAPPLNSTREFVLSNIANDVAQFVAIGSGEVIGWCDVRPKDSPIVAGWAWGCAGIIAGAASENGSSNARSAAPGKKG